MEHYYMIEPLYRRAPSLRRVLWFAAKYAFWMIVTYWFIFNILL